MKLLLEIGTEEIPAHAMPSILADIKEKAAKKLTELRLDFASVRTVGTPRRLTLIVDNLAERQKDISAESKGPSAKIAYDENGNLTKAAIGFARGKKVAPESLIQKDGYIYALIEEKGRPAKELLPDTLKELVTGISFPNSMRWADYSFRFIRPLRWLVALYGADIVPFELAGVTSGRTSRGHRFLSEGEFVIDNADDYERRLEENFVIVDQEKRSDMIRVQIEKTAKDNGGIADITDDLLEEVVYLVEYPTALCGKFDEKYLELPPEAVMTPMRDHQRYFPVKTKEGRLLPLFITIRNGGSDFLDTVRHGNERVLKARLEDAEFFFREDRKKTLAEHREKLKSVVYQEGLGSVYEKTERLMKLAAHIADLTGARETDKQDAVRAAELSKADLVTGMVTEFTELQGIMGREYALLDGEKEAVARAIDEHYMPRFASDSLPKTTAGRIVSVADKIDAIVGTFSRGKIPTGSQDPFALRRQALGIVHTLIAAEKNLPLDDAINFSMDLYGITDETSRKKMQNDVAEFMRLRLKNVLDGEKIRYDAADATLGNVNDPYGTYLRAKAVARFLDEENAARSVQAFVRVGNIAKKAADTGDIDRNLFAADAERELFAAYETAAREAKAAADKNDYDDAIKHLSALAAPIDNFFDKVMVMDDDEKIRRNRLTLMKNLDDAIRKTADFEKCAV